MHNDPYNFAPALALSDAEAAIQAAIQILRDFLADDSYPRDPAPSVIEYGPEGRPIPRPLPPRKGAEFFLGILLDPQEQPFYHVHHEPCLWVSLSNLRTLLTQLERAVAPAFQDSRAPDIATFFRSGEGQSVHHNYQFHFLRAFKISLEIAAAQRAYDAEGGQNPTCSARANVDQAIRRAVAEIPDILRWLRSSTFARFEPMNSVIAVQERRYSSLSPTLSSASEGTVLPNGALSSSAASARSSLPKSK